MGRNESSITGLFDHYLHATHTYSITNGLGLTAAVGFYITTGQIFADVRTMLVCTAMTSSNVEELL